MNCIKIVQIDERNESLIAKLVCLWKSSVLATHLFLSENEIESIEKCIPEALRHCNFLVIAQENVSLVAFMGIEQQRLEMLFVAPEHQGKGIGKMLIKFGIENYQINEMTVNEQNPAAKNFYEHMGFKVYKRTDRDEQGRPYPLLYMRRSC